jgi:hypothetical protein
VPRGQRDGSLRQEAMQEEVVESALDSALEGGLGREGGMRPTAVRQPTSGTTQADASVFFRHI